MRIRPLGINEAVEFVKICAGFPEDIDASAGRYIIDAKSMLGFMGISSYGDIDVQIHTDTQNRWIEFRNAIKEFLANVD